MSIYAIGDLHLSFYKEKPMDIFGARWEHHTERIKEAWEKTVRPTDTVVLAGDLSWAMDEEEVIPDLSFIHMLAGKKIILKGNHEYWWSTTRKLNTLLETQGFHTIRLLYNNAIYIEESRISICGTRGWKCPVFGEDGSLSEFSQQDLKIYKREVQRLELSLREGKRYSDQLLVFMHFPPFNYRQEPSDFTELLESYGAAACFYGHLHGPSHRYALCGVLPQGGNTIYRLISADYMDFLPYKVL